MCITPTTRHTGTGGYGGPSPAPARLSYVRPNRRAYAAAVRILKRARDAAKAADDLESFSQHIATLRVQQRRRPTMIAMLDKAGLR